MTALEGYSPSRPRRRGNGEGTVFKTQRHGCGQYHKAVGFFPCGERSAASCPEAVVVWRAAETIGKTSTGSLVQVKGEGPTRALALERLYNNKVKRAVAAGQLPPDALPLTREQKILTVGLWMDEWMQQKRRLSEQTLAQYETRTRLYITPYFGSTPLRLLTADMVRTHFQKTLVTLEKPTGGRVLGDTAVRGVYFILKQALNAALVQGKILVNPCLAMEPPERTPRSREKNRELARLKSWVPMKLIQELDGHPDEARWLLALFAFRQSEALGLCDDQIISLRDASRARIVVDRQLARRVSKHGCPVDAAGLFTCGKQSDDCPERIGVGELYLKEDLKTPESERTIALVDPLLSALRKHMKRQTKLRESPDFAPLPGMEKLIFTTPTGKPRQGQKDRREWKKILEDARVPELRVHDARHLAASLMMSMGVFTQEQLQRTGGWQDMRTINSVYAHLGAEFARPAILLYGEKLMERRESK